MFSFSRRKKIKSGAGLLKVDIHSHLIPGIDDGSKSMEESIMLLHGLEKLGYERVVTTPHIMFHAYRNTMESVLTGLYELREEAKKENINIRLDAAAEYYLDDEFISLIEKRELLAIDNKYVLFETSFVHRPLDLESAIFDIVLAGFKPLLAHPERYQYINDPKNEFRELKEQGVLFQVNINSLQGYYGPKAHKNALYLSKNGMIDFLGSDLHNKKHLASLESAMQNPVYIDAVKDNNILNNALNLFL